MVRSSILFSALDHEAAADLRRCMVEVRLRRGQVLFRQGEVGDRLYVIADGKVKLGRVASDGRESLLSLLGPGDMFGELSLFDPGPRTSTAAVVADAQVCALERRALEPLLWQRPDLALCLLGRLSRRVRRSAEAQTDLVFHDTPGRVAKTLVDLSARFGTPCDVGLHLRHDLTQEELAQLVGASRETVNKVLADFSDRGWIRTAARAVVLVDIERLRQRAR
jgi:CRP-like cAMP-binding protein